MPDVPVLHSSSSGDFVEMLFECLMNVELYISCQTALQQNCLCGTVWIISTRWRHLPSEQLLRFLKQEVTCSMWWFHMHIPYSALVTVSIVLYNTISNITYWSCYWYQLLLPPTAVKYFYQCYLKCDLWNFTPGTLHIKWLMQSIKGILWNVSIESSNLYNEILKMKRIIDFVTSLFSHKQLIYILRKDK